MEGYKKIKCAFCEKTLWIPPHGDREDAMLPHLPECPGIERSP